MHACTRTNCSVKKRRQRVRATEKERERERESERERERRDREREREREEPVRGKGAWRYIEKAVEENKNVTCQLSDGREVM